METKTKEMNMLSGGLIKNLILFALPLAITSSLQQLFNAADIIVCGRFVGATALAAVGTNSPILNLFINTFLGLSVGANVLIAHYIGAEKKDRIYKVVHTAMTFAVIVGIVFSIFAMLFAKNILLMLSTPENVLPQALSYLTIIIFAFPFMSIYNFGAAILRSKGDTRSPLIILICTGILNVILNIFFVVCFGIGVAGVAYATTISNIVSAIAVVILLMRDKSDIHYDIHIWMLDKKMLYKIARVGVPTAIQGIVFSLSNISVQGAVNTLGTNIIAGNTAATNFEIFPYYIVDSFASACLTFMSQNFGARQYNRCREIVKKSIMLGLICGGIFTIFLEMFATPLSYIFSNDVNVIKYSVERIHFSACLAFTQSIYDCCGAALRVLHYPMMPTIVIAMGTVVFRIIWCQFVFPMYNNYISVIIVYPISWTIINIIMVVAYIVITKKMLPKEN